MVYSLHFLIHCDKLVFIWWANFISETDTLWSWHKITEILLRAPQPLAPVSEGQKPCNSEGDNFAKCVGVHMCRNSSVYMCGSQEALSGVFLYCCLLYLMRQGLLLYLEFAALFRDPLSASSVLGLQVHAATPWLKCLLGTWTWSSCLCRKPLTDEPSPQSQAVLGIKSLPHSQSLFSLKCLHLSHVDVWIQ